MKALSAESDNLNSFYVAHRFEDFKATSVGTLGAEVPTGRSLGLVAC